MSLADQIAWLHEHHGDTVQVREPGGCLTLGFFDLPCGWLWIDGDSPDYWHVTWASGRDSNRWRGGVAIDVDRRSGVGPGGMFLGSWRQVLSMWPERDPRAAAAIYSRIAGAVSRTCRRLGGPA